MWCVLFIMVMRSFNFRDLGIIFRAHIVLHAITKAVYMISPRCCSCGFNEFLCCPHALMLACTLCPDHEKLAPPMIHRFSLLICWTVLSTLICDLCSIAVINVALFWNCWQVGHVYLFRCKELKAHPFDYIAIACLNVMCGHDAVNSKFALFFMISFANEPS
jgi:hypothetical protein